MWKKSALLKLAFVLTVVGSFFMLSTDKAAARCYVQSTGTSGVTRTVMVRSVHDGASSAGTIVNEICNVNPSTHTNIVRPGYYVSAVEIGGYTSSSNCMLDRDAPTGSDSQTQGTNFAKYADKCPSAATAFFDDSGTIVYPGGKVCFGFNDSLCASDAKDYVRDVVIYKPRSSGYLNGRTRSGANHNMAPRAGAPVAYTTTNGRVNSLRIHYTLKQQYLGGFEGRLYLRFTYTPIPPPAVTCAPASQNVSINAPATLTASGGNGTFSWSGGGSPSSGSGSTFTTSFSSAGNRTVTVTSGGVSDDCAVVVEVDECPNLPGAQSTIPDGYIKDGAGNCVPARRPYLRVYGGDVSVGGGIQDTSNGTCAMNTNAGILAFNNGSGAGSAVQLAALAYDAIEQFTTATTQSGGPPKSLSFANTSGTYGGNFGHVDCIPDYRSLTQEGYDFITNSNLSTYPQIGRGRRLVFEKNSDLVINNNVAYQDNGSGGWTNLDDIPSLYVIVDGDIYITPNVTRLDGVYFATGTIYTCAQSNGTTYSASQLTQNCSVNLTVNGAFLANTVKFLRTNGDMSSASPTEGPSPNQAETFYYSPDAYLLSPFRGEAPYQSIRNLPPIL